MQITNEITEKVLVFLSKTLEDDRTTRLISSLPYPKEKIREALRQHAHTLKNDADRIHLRSCYLAPATFINDDDSAFYERMCSTLEGARPPLSGEIREIFLATGLPGSEIDRYEKIFFGIADEEHRLAREIDKELAQAG